MKNGKDLVWNGGYWITRSEFKKRLRSARSAVAQGKTNCATAPEKCHHCALKTAGIYTYGGPEVDWSLLRTKRAILRMFDTSIAALE